MLGLNRIFAADSEITFYHSPIGNSDVPYPYAVDVDENYYLMIDCIMIMANEQLRSQDPYLCYYGDTVMETRPFNNVQILQKRLDYYCSQIDFFSNTFT